MYKFKLNSMFEYLNSKIKITEKDIDKLHIKN
jgi:hypothetical protein